MKVGDLVIRKIPKKKENFYLWKESIRQRRELGHGIVLSKQMAGNPIHPCITVLYPKTGEAYGIGESLMEVVGESR